MTNDKTLQDQSAAGDTTMGIERREPPAAQAASGMELAWNKWSTGTDLRDTDRSNFEAGYHAAIASTQSPALATYSPAVSNIVFTPAQIEAAAKKLAERMHYPWQYMSEEGRTKMRVHAELVIRAAFSE